MKKCITCKLEKEISEFPPHVKTPDGLNRKCRPCYNKYMREWYQKNKEKHKAAVYRYRPTLRARKYGLTVDEMNELFAKYEGLCWCCKKQDAVAIDHCHDSGKVRGALCFDCNTGLGKLGDTIESLRNALGYLETNS